MRMKHRQQPGAGGGGGTALTAPTLTRTSGATTYPPTVDFTRPIDWADTPTMYGVMQRSQDATFATGVTEGGPLQITAAVTTYNFGLSAIVSGSWFIRMAAYTGTRPVSLNWSNIVNVGDVVAPTITSSSTQSSPTFTATANEGVTWAITGGADSAAWTINATTGAVSHIASTVTQSVHTIQITATDYAGNATNQTVTNTLDMTPTAFSFTDITSATRSTLYTSNTITVAGLGTGVTVAVSITGGNYSKNGGAYTSAAGTATNGDTFAVQQTSSASYSTAGNVALTIGTASDTYTVTTLADPSAVVWTPEAAPAAQNIAFGSSSATFTGINFGVGEGIVMVSNSARHTTGVTVGGAACTLVKESNSTAAANSSIWKIAIASGGSKSVVVTGAAALAYVAISTGTLTNANVTETATGALANDFGNDPRTTGSITCPAGGIILAVAGSQEGGALPTWTTGTKVTDVSAGGSNTLRHTTASLSATGAPTLTGFAFTGSDMAAAAWGP